MLFENTSVESINTQVFLVKSINFNFLNLDISVIDFISLFLIFSAFVKSAQIGTHI